MAETLAADQKIKEEAAAQLPGFRFHPTDEELVGFYLRRKVGKKPLSLELITDVDIYKYDPWDLPKMSSVGEKEWYFFCMRGRKYRNSVRPNRVTGSGFWKATGIDKPIYRSAGENHECVGLKKSLVFYKGAAGKGTKTDWMMHEFRLPPVSNSQNVSNEAEVWTLCRIFKKMESYKRYKSNLKNTSKIESFTDTTRTSNSCSWESHEDSNQYITSEDYGDHQQKINMNVALFMHMNPKNHSLAGGHIPAAAQSSTYNTSIWNSNGDDFFKNGGKWDELRSVVDLASDLSNNYHSS